MDSPHLHLGLVFLFLFPIVVKNPGESCQVECVSSNLQLPLMKHQQCITHCTLIALSVFEGGNLKSSLLIFTRACVFKFRCRFRFGSKEQLATFFEIRNSQEKFSHCILRWDWEVCDFAGCSARMFAFVKTKKKKRSVHFGCYYKTQLQISNIMICSPIAIAMDNGQPKRTTLVAN